MAIFYQVPVIKLTSSIFLTTVLWSIFVLQMRKQSPARWITQGPESVMAEPGFKRGCVNPWSGLFLLSVLSSSRGQRGILKTWLTEKFRGLYFWHGLRKKVESRGSSLQWQLTAYNFPEASFLSYQQSSFALKIWMDSLASQFYVCLRNDPLFFWRGPRTPG